MMKFFTKFDLKNSGIKIFESMEDLLKKTNTQIMRNQLQIRVPVCFKSFDKSVLSSGIFKEKPIRDDRTESEHIHCPLFDYVIANDYSIPDTS